jgi:hypothetical protein
MLDQVLALTGGEVGSEAVRRVLGLVEDERYLELLDILAGRRHGEVFTFLEGLLDEGYDLVEFYHGWVEILRTVLRVRLGGSAPDLREDLVESFRARAEVFSPGDLVRMLSLSSELESTGSLRRSGNPRVILEMLLLRLSYLDRTVELEALIRRLGGAPAPGGDAGGAGFTPPAPRGLSARGLATTTPSRGGAPAGRVDPSGAGTGSASAAAPPPSAPASAETRPASPPRSLELTDAWRALASGGRSIPSGLGLFLRAATVREEPPGSVRVALSHGPARERLEDPLVRRALSDALTAEMGRSVTILLETEAGARGGESDGRVTAEAVREGRLRDLLALEPLLGQAVKELDLELLE